MRAALWLASVAVIAAVCLATAHFIGSTIPVLP